MDIETERQLFERRYPDYLMPAEFSPGYLFKRDEDGDYEIGFVSEAWLGWQARAKEAS